MKRNYSWYVFIALILAYVATIFFIPADPHALEKYHLTAAKAQLISVSVALPVIGIWLVAFYGLSRIQRYAQAVKNSTEGPPFHTLVAGLLISVVGLPLSSIVGALLSRLAVVHPELMPSTVIMRNYFNLLLALVAFYLVGNGAEALTRLVRGRRPQLGHQGWVIAFITCASLFAWLITTQQAGSNVYYLPDWLVIMTLVIPYTYIWYRGAAAAYCMYFYQKNIQGSLYRRALSSLSAGIAVVIGASMFLQFLTTFSERISRLNLTPILMLIYLIVVLWAIGYGFIARGAKRLHTMEEV
jgi:predicted membrane protein